MMYKNNINITRAAVLALLAMIAVSLAGCGNPFEQPARPQTAERAVVCISVSRNGARTVFPSADIAEYILNGGLSGSPETLLTEFTTGDLAAGETTVSLAEGTWNFTLSAYNNAGELILKGQVTNKPINANGANLITFELLPLTGGTGGIRITVHFPSDAGITKVTAGGDIAAENFNITGGAGTFVYEKSNVNAGYYFASFKFYRGNETEPATVVSEMVQVGNNMISGKTITLSANDINENDDSNLVAAQGTNAINKLQWISNNVASDTHYLVELSANESIAPQTLSYTGKSGVSITLAGGASERSLSLSSQGSMFTVGAGVTLYIKNNVTLQGRASNNSPLIHVAADGTLVLSDGGKITGNTSTAHGGGVITYGAFTMNGGEVSGNKTSGTWIDGGGVIVGGGTFTMNGGKISGNDAAGGGGVWIRVGSFNMYGGEISGNTGRIGGAGISVGEGTTFTLYDGKISGNIGEGFGGGVLVGAGVFTMKGGEISGNTSNGSDRNGTYGGGGVHISGDNYSANFIMEGGIITGNTAPYGSGGGVNLDPVRGGVFTMTGGEISGNSAAVSGGGVRVNSGTSRFTKTGGTITGYASDTVNGNVVKNASGTAVNSKGHAVYVDTSSAKRQESTAGPTVNLSYDSSNGSSAGWEY